MSSPHVMLFDLYAGGHHGQYVRQLVEYWNAHALTGRLTVLAPQDFFLRHGDIPRIAAQSRANNVLCTPIKETVDTRGFIRGALTHGRILERYVKVLRPTHVLCLYFDHMQLSLAIKLRFNFPVALSGIYFRPTFHYDATSIRGLEERIGRTRKRLLLRATLRNPHFNTLFCLDPYVIPHIKPANVQLVALPDGAQMRPPLLSANKQRAHWDIDADRRVALLFGSLAARKGIYKMLDALRVLPRSGQRQLALAIIGRSAPHEQSHLKDQIRRARAATEVQVIHEDRFVEEEEIPALFDGADLVLLPYQRHIGSSGVLVRAAQACIPVLGQSFGLVGRHIRAHHLGMAVDSTCPKALAAGLETWLRGDDLSFDPCRASAFGAANTAEHFSQTIFCALLQDSSLGVTP